MMPLVGSSRSNPIVELLINSFWTTTKLRYHVKLNEFSIQNKLTINK